MSSPDHSTSNIEDAFSSNFLDYTTASSGNISPNPPDNLSKYLFTSLAISPFHNVQEYNVVANKPHISPQDPITPPTILNPSLVLSFMYSNLTLKGQENLKIKVRTDGGDVERLYDESLGLEV
nr:hypothetical protein [Tanacetum cinerariifolium]